MILSRTPLRVSFFGGGTDFEDYYKLDHGCVLTSTIDKYIYLMVNRKFDRTIQLNYKITEIVSSIDEIRHPTIREGMRLVGINKEFELSAIADVPAHGTGLGSSSSFIVGALNAMHTYKKENVDAEQLATEACKIEIDVLKEPIGKQDQYIAAYGGFRFIRFSRDGTVTVTKINASEETIGRLYKKLMFFYTGGGRKASDILTTQKRNIKDKIETLNKMRQIANKMHKQLDNKVIDGFGEALNDSWKLKRSLADKISNDIIDAYYEKAMMAGASGGKILGAGGSGFLMFYCEEEKQSVVRKALSNLREVCFKFEEEGTKIIYNDTG
ncbi:GHMP kinase [Candidatus Micrarchaeota archaeon]|nr:GHMP kinase [Candidatus Micrarchaeota archaeon]